MATMARHTRRWQSDPSLTLLANFAYDAINILSRASGRRQANIRGGLLALRPRISKKIFNQVQRLNEAYQVLRHPSQAYCNDLLTELAAQLNETDNHEDDSLLPPFLAPASSPLSVASACSSGQGLSDDGILDRLSVMERMLEDATAGLALFANRELDSTLQVPTLKTSEFVAPLGASPIADDFVAYDLDCSMIDACVQRTPSDFCADSSSQSDSSGNIVDLPTVSSPASEIASGMIAESSKRTEQKIAAMSAKIDDKNEKRVHAQAIERTAKLLAPRKSKK